VPQPRCGVVAAKLDGPRECFFPARCVATAQEHLAQKAIGLSISWGGLSGLHERGLRLCKQPGVQVHATHGQHHRMVVFVPCLGGIADLSHQLGFSGHAEVRAQGDSGLRVGVLAPTVDQFVQSLHESIEQAGSFRKSFTLFFGTGRRVGAFLGHNLRFGENGESQKTSPKGNTWGVRQRCLG
jgi:hypothetical protein